MIINWRHTGKNAIIYCQIIFLLLLADVSSLTITKYCNIIINNSDSDSQQPTDLENKKKENEEHTTQSLWFYCNVV